MITRIDPIGIAVNDLDEASKVYRDALELVQRVAGGMNGILFDHAAGVMHGAACWRADGAPIGLSGGPARQGIVGQTMYRIA